MQFSTIFSLVACLSLGAASPVERSPVTTKRTTGFEIIQLDPTQGANFTLYVPLVGDPVPTNSDLSISTVVSSFNLLQSKCNFTYPYAASTLVLTGPGIWDVRPPQAIKSVACSG